MFPHCILYVAYVMHARDALYSRVQHCLLFSYMDGWLSYFYAPGLNDRWGGGHTLSTFFYKSCLMNFKLHDPNQILTEPCKLCIILICFECWILPQFCFLEFFVRMFKKSICKCCTLDLHAIFYINYRKTIP